MSIDVLLGVQWGDEGKGKIVDFLAHNYNIVARFQGGPNAGHTLYYQNKKIVLHHIPSGIFHDNTINLIGNGVIIDPVTLLKEVAKVKAVGGDVADKLFIGRKAHLILPTHRLLDKAYEEAKGKNKIGSTLRGIGPTYTDKTSRNGLRIGDIELSGFEQRYQQLKERHLKLLSLYDLEFDLAPLEEEWLENIEQLRRFNLVNGVYFVQDSLAKGQNILAEGAQGTMLDIDFGTYPYVTSSNTITAGVCTGLGVAPQQIKEVFGVTKAYCTRVGSGPFPTELHDETGEKIRQLGGEFGATTGRPRRCGWMDLPALKYACLINGITQLVITKADILSEFENLQIATAYQINGQTTEELPFDMNPSSDIKAVYQTLEGWKCNLDNYIHFDELPFDLKNYMEFIQQETGVPVRILSTGPKRNQLVHGEINMEMV